MRPTLLAVLISACSPFNGGEQFHCQGDGDCGAGGMCAIGDLCAYPNSACPDPGEAYGDSAGPLSGMCVPPVGVAIDAGSGGGPDPTADAFVVPPDAPPTSECEGNPNVLAVCIGIPQQDRDFTNKTLFSHGDIFGNDSDCDFLITVPDTENKCMGSACQAQGPQLCVIQGHNITLSNTKLRDPSGSRPLVFVATGDINVTGPVDASTKRGNTVAPGAATGNCNSASAQNRGGGGGGGGGGAYGTPGGNGGKGAGNNANGGGTQSVPADFSVVRSGCRGGYGANSDNGVFTGFQGGDGGFSGGVVYLIAKGTINITSTLDVSGMGGGAAETSSGGGGGGPGGMLALDAHVININAPVIANGGAGGGAGGAGVVSKHGNQYRLDDPENGSSGKSGAQMRATGGDGGGDDKGTGGNGGDGTDGQNANGENGHDQNGSFCGGGGGGGGQGIVWLVARPGDTTNGTTNIVGVKISKQ